MTRSRLILLCAGLVLILGVAWLWWMRPQKVDMATYAPADSLLYIQIDDPSEVVKAVTQTGAWKAFQGSTGVSYSEGNQRLQSVIGWTGIGPIQSVLLARAQIAVVLTGLGTTEAGETLKVKSEGAILIETHTSERRIKAPFEEFLRTFAERLYGRPTLQRINSDGVEFVEWTAPDSSRRIVGTVAGSLLIIGTSEDVVQACLAASQGRRPSLKDDAELKRLRAQLAKDGALTFGYVPPANSAKLLAFGIPLLLGRAPGDSDFQRFIANGATKIFGSMGWSSRAYSTGIEDRYLFALQPTAIERLKPGFNPGVTNLNLQNILPDSVYSASSYRFSEPVAAWQGLKGAVSSQVDALSTVVFSSLLKSSLLSYGIDDPEKFLAAIGGEMMTMRLDEYAERSLLVAAVKNREALRQIIQQTKSLRSGSGAERLEIFEDAAGEYAAALMDDFVIMGEPRDVRRYIELKRGGSLLTAEKLRQLTLYHSPSSSANVVTFTSDESRVRNFFSTILAARAIDASTLANFENQAVALPYSVTETVLGNNGIERTTRSPLGQFSTLLPLLLPEQSDSNRSTNKSP